MSEQIEVAAQALNKNDRLLLASQIATATAANPVIKTHDDLEVWAGNRAKVKAGIKAIEDGLTEAFRPYKQFERDLRARFAPMRDQLAKICEHMDRQELAFRDSERRRLAAEAAERDRLAKLAAEAAKREEELFGEDAPPPPQVMAAPEAPRTVKGAGGATWETVTVSAEAVDVLEIAKHSPHLLKLDVAAALREFKVMRDRGQVDNPPEEGKVYNGILYRGVRGIAGGKR